MPRGFPGSIFILAFDHRGNLLRLLGGDRDAIGDAKQLIFEGVLRALERGADPATAGVLIDEQFGADVARRAKAAGLKLAMPVNHPEADELDFEHGPGWREHVLAFDPDLAKVLVRYDPDGDRERNMRQLARLKEMSDWLAATGHGFLVEVLTPDAERRPDLTVRAIQAIQDFGIEADLWKLEGVAGRVDAERLVGQARAGDRAQVGCVVLGKGADEEKVEQWLRQTAPVDGFVGFAIGRSIWADAVVAHHAGDIARAAAADRIADRYLRYVRIYEDAASRAGALPL